MPRLTLRTLLAYIDDTLEPDEARSLGKKVAESEDAQQLVERIKRVTRRRGLSTPVPTADDETADPNNVAAYLDNTLDSDTLRQVEETCLESDVHLAEVAACHQILTLVLTEPVRVPPSANQRMYKLVKRPVSDHNRRPGNTLPLSEVRVPENEQPDRDDADAALLLGMKRYSAASGWPARLLLIGVAAALLVFLFGAVLMALPKSPPRPPETSPGYSFAQVSTPAPAQVTVVTPPPDTKPRDTEPGPGPAKPPEPGPTPDVPKPREVDPSTVFAQVVGIAATEVAKKPADAGAFPDPVPPPRPERMELAKIESPSREMIVTQPPPAPGEGLTWHRLKFKPDDNERIGQVTRSWRCRATSRKW